MAQYLFSLVNRPSFLEGMVRVLDLGGTLNIYNGSPLEVEADIEAIKSDWDAVGLDLGEAIEFEKQKSDSE